ncbi:hypothetical protein SCHPADRAFT_256601 [Schizopora paradoxa]|uniref:F-box domain-containing protein n=1 Tax=Schizopora paradoxa TaxID=27342 RepID=A0A0H2RVH7_9AGAM|nr:hypothetical protein SCHPADRAFT_256601 [Schizopora paradoxa]
MHILDIPPETIEVVFAYALLAPDPRCSKFSVSLPPIRAQGQLYPLLFVCKDWYFIARRLLYSSLHLGDGWKTKKTMDIQQILEKFEANPHLASLVRTLNLRPSGQPRAETLQLAQVIRLCENLRCVVITGYDVRDGPELKDAIFGKDLEKLIVYGDVAGKTGRPVNAVPFCSASEMIAYVARNLSLRKLSTDTALHLPDDESILPDSSAIRSSRSSLREIRIERDILSEKHLHILSQLAFNVERASFSDKSIGARVVRLCLESWASTLRYLHLDSSDDSTSIEDAGGRLVNLGGLEACSANIPSTVLVNFKHLRSLIYTCTLKDFEVLARILRDPHSVPVLHALILERTQKDKNEDWDNDEGLSVMNDIQESCDQRKMVLIFRDFDDPLFELYHDQDKERKKRMAQSDLMAS